MNPEKSALFPRHDVPASAAKAHRGDYLPTLDGWRAVAILLVIVGHAMDDIAAALRTLWPDFMPGQLKFLGMQGVQVFFGLSGFLITRKLLDDERAHGRISLWAFYVRRAFRILPAALAFLLAVGALSLAGVLDVSLGRWLSALLFAANYSTADYSWYLGHFWSLAVEEHFYLVWPALFLVLASVRRRLHGAIALAVLVALWRAADFRFQLTGSSPALFMGRTDIRVDHLVWGVVVALALADADWGPRLRRWLTQGRVAGLLVLALVAMLFVPAVDWKLKFALMSVHGLLVPLAIAATCLNAGGFLGRWLEAAPMRWLGRHSFSIYLWQQLFVVWTVARVPALAPLQDAPYNLVALALCAALSYRLVEQPGIALGRRVLARWPGLPARLRRVTSPVFAQRIVP